MNLFLSLLLAGTTLAAAPVTQVTMVDAGHPVQKYGRQFVGPYTISLNGQDLPALCIDFKDETHPMEQWQAYASRLDGDLDDTYRPDELIEYQEEAYLYTLILLPNADRLDIQHAAWAITDSAYHANAAAKRWIEAAMHGYGSIQLSRFEIISETRSHCPQREQEFIVELPVPEPATINLLAGLLVVSLAAINRRKR